LSAEQPTSDTHGAGDEGSSKGHSGHRPGHPAFAALSLAALGVVFGDIGTSPLYTLRECLSGEGHAPRPGDVLGVLSLIFWSLTFVVTVKYLVFVMRADYKGEGGIFALLGVVPERLRKVEHGKITPIAFLVVLGAALLYGDGAITPAISVLSAVEGMAIAKPSLAALTVPVTCVILLGLFAIQRRGTGSVGRLFGPVMLLWFGTIGLLGLWHIAQYPAILAALSPHHAVAYFAEHGLQGALILGSVVLAVTGGEALYADMGHFGVSPIRFVWLALVFPALVLCYFGQGALALRDPAALQNPFFAMVPTGVATVALVLLSSAATVIASQALISGAFSLTRQAMQLGYFPRVTIKHTADHTEGQIYIHEVNWLLAAMCIFLVLAFRASDRLASAYGIAVTGTMTITSIVFYVVMRETWGWSRARALPILLLFLSFDIPFFVANTFKLMDGGWVPVVIGMVIITAMLIWNRGRTLVLEQANGRLPRVNDALSRIRAQLVARSPGTAVYLTSTPDRMPSALIHQVECLRVLHEHVVLLNIQIADVGVVPAAERLDVLELGDGFYQVTAHYGFVEQPNIMDLMTATQISDVFPFAPENTTYFLGRETILARETGGMGKVAEGVYAFLQRNAVAADRHFGIPPAQAFEVGTQIDL